MLCSRIKKFESIVDAVDLESPLTASHLLVAACVEGYSIYSVLRSWLKKEKNMLLSYGCSRLQPITPLWTNLQSATRNLAEGTGRVFYVAYQQTEGVFTQIHIEKKLRDTAESARNDIEQALEEEWSVLQRIVRYSQRECNYVVDLKKDSLHKEVYPMLDFLKCLLAESQKISAEIDAFLVKPTAGMIEELLASKFNDARQGWLESRVKRGFDYDRREFLKFVAEGSRESMELELEFLRERESGLSSDNEYCEIWRALRLNYDNVADEYDLRRAANDLHRMEWADDIEKECNYLYFIAEDALLYSYIFSEIKRLKEEQEKNDEPKVKNDIKSADVVDLSKDDVKKDLQNGNRGRKAESLFDNPKTQSEYAELFSDFLNSRKKTNVKVDTKMDNYINKAFVAFYLICRAKGLVEKTVNGHASYRFLLNDCRLEFECGEKTYGGFIRTYVNEVTKRDTKVNEKYAEKILTIRAKIEDFMKNI